MSAGTQGRFAALPPTSYRPTARRLGADGLIVRFVPENPEEEPREFDFRGMKVDAALRKAFATAFKERTRAGGRVRTVQSANKTWQILRQFSDYLASLVSPPASSAELTRMHLQGWYLIRRDHAGVNLKLSELKLTLRKIDGLSAEFLDALNEPLPSRTKTSTKRNYSRAENQRILNAARIDVRRAARRIRAGRDLLQRWRSGDLDNAPEEVRCLGELLDYVDIHADVPRTPCQQVPVTWVHRLAGVSGFCN